LRGKDHGDEQLERVGVSQLAMRVGIGFLKTGDDFPQSRGFGFGRFAWHYRQNFNHEARPARRKTSFVNEFSVV
jgi:hypothetical protein